MSTSMFNFDRELVVKTTLSSYNVFVHILMGLTVGIPILFAVVKNFDVTSPSADIIMLHILLCVFGYQVLMSQAFLSLCPCNTWSSNLNQTVQRRIHLILQLLASGLAIGGSIVIMINKDVNFDSTHGKIGLAALIFTMMNLLTGIPTIFAERLSKFIPSYVPKLVHIVLGIVAYSCASSCLCYGFDMQSFRTWTNNDIATGIIAISGIFTFIILINPLITLCKEVIQIVKSYRSQ